MNLFRGQKVKKFYIKFEAGRRVARTELSVRERAGSYYSISQSVKDFDNN